MNYKTLVCIISLVISLHITHIYYVMYGDTMRWGFINIGAAQEQLSLMMFFGINSLALSIILTVEIVHTIKKKYKCSA